MTCTWWGDKESTIKDFRGPPVRILGFKLLSKWNYPMFPRLRSRCSVTDPEVRHNQSRQRQDLLLGPNWSLLQLMASCGCVFTSHLFCVLCFPAPETREANFKCIPTTLCLCASLTVCLPPLLYSETKEVGLLQAAAQWLIPEVPPQNQLLPGRFCPSTKKYAWHKQ